MIDDLIVDPNFKDNGLTDSQVDYSREKNGFNKIDKKKKTPLIIQILNHLKDPMIILLMIIGFISIIVTCLKASGQFGEDKVPKGLELASSIIEPLIIFGTVVANIIFEMRQEKRTDKDIESLQKLTSPKAKVIRNSELQIIDSKDIVVGDLLFLEAGDQISADAKLIESFNLEVNESILTGESLLVKKDPNGYDESKRLIEQKNMIFSGTSIISGSAKAVVTNIGSKTEMGQISELIKNEKDNLTPFQKQLSKLTKWLGFIAIGISIITFFVNILLLSNGGFNIKEYWQSSLEVSIALSIAEIPESMIAIVMIVLASAVRRMSVKKALIKRLPSVETLGSTSIICSDKTGTLTQNKMTVVQMWNTKLKTLTDDKTQNLKILKYGTLCTNGSVNYNENNEIELVGDPTETSIIQALLDLNISKNDLHKEYARLLELPFDSDRKMMSVVVEDLKTKQKTVITKGAPDQVFNICKQTNKSILNDAQKYNIEMSSKALRVLAVSYKVIDQIPTDTSTLETDQELIGVLGIIDPPREEVKQSIKECLQAGIRPIMITGDYKNTAVAIAQELGIMLPGTSALSGDELLNISDEDLEKNIEKYSVYARVSPQDKIRIVKAWQAAGKIVSMTGDGVNDAPSLKAADIGCAMGITGTDVSKQAADLILTDDNFSTIVEAVKEGRKVMNNIKNVLVFLLITSFASLITIFIGMIIFGGSYFSSIQILWSNILTEAIPAIGLGLSRNKDDVMRFKPRNKTSNIIGYREVIKIAIISLLTSVLSLIAFYIGISCAMQSNDISAIISNISDNSSQWNFSSNEIYSHAWDISYIRNNFGIWVESPLKILIYSGSSLSFITLTICLASNAFSLRSHNSIFKNNIRDSKYTIYSFFGALFITCLVSYIPYLNYAFNMNTYKYNENTIGFGSYSWINIIPYLFVLIIIFVYEIIKIVERKLIKKDMNWKNGYYL